MDHELSCVCQAHRAARAHTTLWPHLTPHQPNCPSSLLATSLNKEPSLPPPPSPPDPLFFFPIKLSFSFFPTSYGGENSLPLPYLTTLVGVDLKFFLPLLKAPKGWTWPDLLQCRPTHYSLSMSHPVTNSLGPNQSSIQAHTWYLHHWWTRTPNT